MIAITGHTRGIGKAIFDLHSESIGFSRANGYDISEPEVVKQIVEIVSDMNCDVFINNAYSGDAQMLMFRRIYEEWKNNDSKTIVNINSRTIYNKPNNRQYTADKKILRSVAIEALNDVTRKCRIININAGYVKTDRTSKLSCNMLTPQQLADMIKWCLDQPQNIEVGELSVWCTTLD